MDCFALIVRSSCPGPDIALALTTHYFLVKKGIGIPFLTRQHLAEEQVHDEATPYLACMFVQLHTGLPVYSHKQLQSQQT